MIPYLLIADLQNTALSAILAFSDRVLYRCYSAMPRLFGFSPLEDQVAAGATMWVGGSLAFVVRQSLLLCSACRGALPNVVSPGIGHQMDPTPFSRPRSGFVGFRCK